MIERRYEILYNESKNVLTLYKITDNKVAEETEGKYGIIISRDVNGDIIKIDIPEPESVFSIDIDDLKRF